MTFSGRFVAAASDVIGMDDVFDARIASGGSASSARRKIAFFTSGVLDDRLDQEVGLDHVVHLGQALQHLLGRSASLLGELRQALLHPGDRSLDRSGDLVVERDAPAGRRDDLRDAAAHLACSDDEYVLESHALSISERGQTRGV